MKRCIRHGLLRSDKQGWHLPLGSFVERRQLSQIKRFKRLISHCSQILNIIADTHILQINCIVFSMYIRIYIHVFLFDHSHNFYFKSKVY